MRISVFLKPTAKKQEVLQYNGIFRVSVKSPPKDNEANEELIEVLAKHFGIPKNCVGIVSGFNSRNKIVEISSGPK